MDVCESRTPERIHMTRMKYGHEYALEEILC